MRGFLGCGVALAALIVSTLAMADDKPTGPTGFYFDSKMIAALHAKGGGRMFEKAGQNYHVIAGQHTAPNAAEIHQHAADIVYFIDGSATVVTGGTVVNPKNTAPGEIVGTALEGGEAHHVGPGDVIVMLPGTPHWFQKVDGHIDYMTIHLDHLGE